MTRPMLITDPPKRVALQQPKRTASAEYNCNSPLGTLRKLLKVNTMATNACKKGIILQYDYT